MLSDGKYLYPTKVRVLTKEEARNFFKMPAVGDFFFCEEVQATCLFNGKYWTYTDDGESITLNL